MNPTFLEFTTSKGKSRLINLSRVAEVFPHGEAALTNISFDSGRTTLVQGNYAEITSRIHTCVGLSPSQHIPADLKFDKAFSLAINSLRQIGEGRVKDGIAAAELAVSIITQEYPEEVCACTTS